MEFFSWCMAYPCPYGPCDEAEIEQWKKEQAVIIERRQSRKYSRRALNEKPVRNPSCTPKYSRLPCRLSRYQLSCPVCQLRTIKLKLRHWVLQQRKPYSAVSVQIDRLTSEQYDEDDLSGIIDLIEVIRIQGSGPTEAARAIRKKLKYGNAHRQIRALAILDGLIQNAGSRFQKTFADEPLLERLRLMVRDDMVDLEVRNKCNVLFRQWAVAYKDTQGLHNIANLYKQLPQKKTAPKPSKVLRETEADVQDEHSPPPAPPSGGHSRGHSRTGSGVVASGSTSRPVSLSATPHFSSASKSSKKKDKQAKFSLEKEKPAIMQAIASASVASTNLLNALQLINRETQRVSENPEVMNRFETCKGLRRQILRYIQLVESDDWIGSLLSANDELVKALTSYEIMDKSLDDDSDSDAWEHLPDEAKTGTEAQLAGLNLGGGDAAPPKPPRPGSTGLPPKPPRPEHGKAKAESESESESEEEDDEDNPFGDSNAV